MYTSLLEEVSFISPCYFTMIHWFIKSGYVIHFQVWSLWRRVVNKSSDYNGFGVTFVEPDSPQLWITSHKWWPLGQFRLVSELPLRRHLCPPSLNFCSPVCLPTKTRTRVVIEWATACICLIHVECIKIVLPHTDKSWFAHLISSFLGITHVYKMRVVSSHVIYNYVDKWKLQMCNKVRVKRKYSLCSSRNLILTMAPFKGNVLHTHLSMQVQAHIQWHITTHNGLGASCCC